MRPNSIILAAILVSACGTTPSHDRIVTIETRGNLKATQDIACGKPSKIWRQYTPPDLYGGMAKCIEDDNYISAVYFYVVAGTFSYYDSLRVSDKTAREAHTILLQNSVDSLNEGERDSFMGAVQVLLGNADGLTIVCATVARIRAPQYHPSYMIQHGEKAILNGEPGKELVKDFDSKSAWRKALNNHLHCKM